MDCKTSKPRRSDRNRCHHAPERWEDVYDAGEPSPSSTRCRDLEAERRFLWREADMRFDAGELSSSTWDEDDEPCPARFALCG